MTLLDKVLSNVHACAIEIAFEGDTIPSTITGWQPFHNSLFENATFHKAYATLSSLEFSEESISSASGTSFRQKIIWRFPENDKNRAERIALIHKIKFVKFIYTNGQHLVFGRNDISQNTKPKIQTNSNGQLCQVEMESLSISPAAFTPNPNWFGLPSLIPLSF